MYKNSQKLYIYNSGQDGCNFDDSPCCEMAVPVKNAGTFGAQTNSLCYKRAASVSPIIVEGEAMTLNIADMTSERISDWLTPIVNGGIFTSREKLVALFREGAPHETLEDEFREFFNGYYVLALELEEYEKSILGIIEEDETFAHLKHRVLAVEAQRKSSPLGREARRMGLSVHDDPVPEIKVAELSSNEFQVLIHTLGNWRLFVARNRLVKLMETKASIEIADRLRAEFYEFFVCYLELELFLENYDYDPDDGLELRPEFIEALEREEAYIRSGGKMYTLDEVAAGLGISRKRSSVYE